MPIVVEVKSARGLHELGRRAEEEARRRAEDDPNKKWDDKELVARGEKVYGGQLRRLPSGDRQGHAARLPAARRLEDRRAGRKRATSTSC